MRSQGDCGAVAAATADAFRVFRAAGIRSADSRLAQEEGTARAAAPQGRGWRRHRSRPEARITTRTPAGRHERTGRRVRIPRRGEDSFARASPVRVLCSRAVRLGGTEVRNELVLTLAGLLRLGGFDSTAAKLEAALTWGEPVVPLTSLDRDCLLRVLTNPSAELEALRTALATDRDHDRSPGPSAGLRYTECDCVSDTGPGWVALIAKDPDDEEPSTVVSFCPPCAARVLEYEPRSPATPDSSTSAPPWAAPDLPSRESGRGIPVARIIRAYRQATQTARAAQHALCHNVLRRSRADVDLGRNRRSLRARDGAFPRLGRDRLRRRCTTTVGAFLLRRPVSRFPDEFLKDRAAQSEPSRGTRHPRRSRRAWHCRPRVSSRSRQPCDVNVGPPGVEPGTNRL
jgi:hypothetical protein